MQFELRGWGITGRDREVERGERGRVQRRTWKERETPLVLTDVSLSKTAPQEARQTNRNNPLWSTSPWVLGEGQESQQLRRLQ